MGKLQLFIVSVSPRSVMLHHIKTRLFVPVFLVRFPFMDQIDDGALQSFIHFRIQVSSPWGYDKPNLVLHLQFLIGIVLVMIISLHSSKNRVNN